VLLFAVLLLGWLLLEQDGRLQQERNRERMAAAAERLAAGLEQRLSGLRDGVTQMAVSYPEGSAAVEDAPASQPESFIGILVRDKDLVVAPESALHYVPAAYRVTRPAHPWAEATRLEFEQGDLPAALQWLQSMAGDGPDWLRAGTLARQARVLKRLGRVDEALARYAQLATLEGEYVEAIPAPWLALLASSSIHESSGDAEPLRQTLLRLLETLRRGGYRVDKSTYRFYRESVEPLRDRYLPGAEALPADWPVSEAIAELTAVHAEWRNGLGAAEGLRIHPAPGGGLLVLWRTFQEGLVGGVLPLASLADQSIRELTADIGGRGIGWRVTDAAGQELLTGGQAQPGGISESVLLNLMGATLRVDAFATPALSAEPVDRVRRHMLLAGLLLVLSVILAGTYFTARALRREAEVANLQSEFISAVSHEFRTPLTSIRQVTELLDSGRVQEPQRQREYFQILHREAQRLQRMVEDLLDFGRLEADARPYRPERFDLTAFLRDLAGEFAAERRLDAASLQLQLEEDACVHMDRESLGRALWNLLDNALKYSTGAPEIALTLTREGGRVSIAVADRGVGISESDRQRVFDKFVRGSAAETTRAKGTGLGLAMVKKIIEDQDGSIRVSSRAGGGARFIISLPSVEKT
jgi:two-component system phosphate regulon sensor histidine kinase PhoR